MVAGNLPHEIEIDLSKLADFSWVTIGSSTLPAVKSTADAELNIAASHVL
jgi:hypothetical protein